MDAVNYSFARQNLTSVMDRVNQDHAPLLVTRQKGEPIVMMSLADFNALEETAYLLRSPKNAICLVKAIEQLRQGGGSFHEIVDDN
ncbi:MAG: type II toxin-antitoxin system prevent-host-death family antitoxin [Sulfuricella sp.]